MLTGGEDPGGDGLCGGVSFDPQKTELFIGPIKVADGGRQAEFDEDVLSDYLKEKEISMTIDLHSGPEELRTWGVTI